ncbi:uncharacterized protein LOC143057937 isoform X2 [Mytilus galloprovincialis]|uniref:uncharacterized protein LOC143057937 isoform X2 n=1 Tax=Mytilus galloprovincialis TaxID=29158 RepID=UPI003F7CBFAD
MFRPFSTQTSVREPRYRNYNVAMFHERCCGNTHGWLRILTENIFRKTWKLKYIFLFDGCIYIFPDEKASKPSNSYCLYSFNRVVRIENGRPTCLEFALCPCMPDIPKPKFFSASSEDELQRWIVAFELEIQNANSTRNPTSVTTRRSSSAQMEEHYNRQPQLSHITTSRPIQVNQQHFENLHYMGDINYGQGKDRPRTLPTGVIGNQNSSHYCNDSRSRQTQTHSNFTTGRPSRMQNMQDLTLRYGQAVSISNLQNVDQRPVPEIHCQTVAHGFNRRAVSMANIPAVPVSSNNLPGFLHQDQATISEDNNVYATVQKKINEDQEEGPYLTVVSDDNNKDIDRETLFTVNSSDDQKQEESQSRLKPQTCTSENIYDDPDETDEQEQQESQSSLRPLTCTSESIYDYPDQRGSRTKTICRNSDTVTMADSVDHSKSSATSSCETDGSNSEGYSYVTPPNKCLNSKDAHIGRNQTEVDSTQFMCEEKRHNYKIPVMKSITKDIQTCILQILAMTVTIRTICVQKIIYLIQKKTQTVAINVWRIAINMWSIVMKILSIVINGRRLHFPVAIHGFHLNRFSKLYITD